jgi:hypothetical protein
MTETIKHLLSEAWRHRRAQDLPACMDFLSELKAELSLPYARLKLGTITTMLQSKVTKLPASILDVTLETLIFWASLLRAQRELPLSQEFLQFVESYLGLVDYESRRPLIAKLAQEQGLNAYACADFTTALEHFAVQGRLAKNDIERTMGHVNGLLCYESLGLPTMMIHKRARDAIASLSAIDRESCRELEHVVVDFERRYAFCRGDIHYLADGPMSETRFSAYMRAWMSNLPWHLHFHQGRQLTDLMAAMIPDEGALHLRDFRTRTLQGISLPNDPVQMPAGELAIRAYLWTWRWLINPADFDVQRILDTLASPVLVENANSIPPMQAYMLRNVALWISLFCAHHASRLERWSKSLPACNPDEFLIFSWESLLIRYIEAKHHNNLNQTHDILTVTRSLPPSSENAILFGEMISSLDNPSELTNLLNRAPWLQLMFKNLGATFTQVTSATKETLIQDAAASTQPCVRVDLLTHEVKHGESAKNSRGLAIGLALLKSREQISRADFAMLVWGIHNYEPDYHDMKILNLLSRMRALVGSGVKIGVKNHLVYGHGDWSKVEVVGSLMHVADISQARISLRSGGRREEVAQTEAATLRKARALIEDHVTQTKATKLTRRDIESILDLPRSSANRLIDKLAKHKVLMPRHYGPKRYYEFKTKWGESV